MFQAAAAYAHLLFPLLYLLVIICQLSLAWCWLHAGAMSAAGTDTRQGHVPAHMAAAGSALQRVDCVHSLHSQCQHALATCRQHHALAGCFNTRAGYDSWLLLRKHKLCLFAGVQCLALQTRALQL